jgi:hypothetical protein
MDAIAGAPSIGHWTSKRPFYFLEVFRAYRKYFPGSQLTKIYWLSAVAACIIESFLQFSGHNELWLQAILFLVGIGILAIRFTSPHHEPMFQ